MSTRAAIHFEDRVTYRWDAETGARTLLDEPEIRTQAIIYRHSDGYPEGLGNDLIEFIDEVRQLRDTRLSEPSYLAAKWVVWDATRYHEYMLDSNERQREHGEKPYYPEPVSRLDFLGVGVVMSDPGDIEYRYHIICDGRVETITYEHIGYEEWPNVRPTTTGVISTLRPDMVISA